jgi:predicted TIM-barrel fold metal-dependent hydrolase
MIIDANVHATRHGRWFDTDLDCSLGALLHAMDRAGVDRAVLTGIAGQMSTADILAMCGEAGGRLLAVPAFDPSAYPTPDAVRRAACDQLAERGLTGVKLHPRFGRYDVLDERVLALLEELSGWDIRLGVWICTLLHVPGLRPLRGPVEALCEIVGRFPELTFVLVHGGGPDLLRLATAVRSAGNALLELSYTITHLRSGSVGLDLELLIATFEQRLVFGSDHPEGDISAARAGLAELAAPEAARLVLGENLHRALGLES